MKILGVLLGAALLSCSSTPALQSDEGWVSLFDGKSLSGWVQRGGGVWTVDQGTILGVTGSGAYGWLCSEKNYGDFILECEAKVEGPGNSGVQVRSHIDEKDLMVGYQFDLDKSRPSTGRLYDEARRKLLQDVPLRPEARQALKPDDWNLLKLECTGDRLRSWVNGVAIADVVDSVDLSGILALQVHSGRDTKVRWRNFRLKDLGTRHWEALWNGKDLAGWHSVGEGDWKVQNGGLNGRTPKRGFAAFATDAAYKEFTLRIVFQKVEGKAGLRFGTASVDGRAGSQVALIGGKAEGWNEIVVSAHEGRTVVHLNGDRLSDVQAAASAEPGPIAIELVGEGSNVLLKSVEILGAPKRP